MKILILTDKFKGTLNSLEAGNIIAEVTGGEVIAVSDGGDGFLEAVLPQSGEIQNITAYDPLMRKISVRYGICGKTAYIESALVTGLSLLDAEEHNPAVTTTFGLGEMIIDAMNKGVKEIIIGLGGSSTNDCGAGMLEALGAVFYGKSGIIKTLCGGVLAEIYKIDINNLDKRLKDIKITACCDVQNPLLGVNGAAYCFSPQKGADMDMVKFLDRGLRNFAGTIKNTIGFADYNFSGGGAAGGFGYCLKAFFNAKIKSGFDLLELDEKVLNADIIITGEGCFDSQSVRGKLPYRVKTLADKYNKRCICLCGCVDTEDFGSFNEIYYTYPKPPLFTLTKQQAAENLRRLAINLNF